MAHVFIVWNRNYNKLVDFINYYIRTTENPCLTVHAFVDKSIAKKDSPLNLQYIVQHECFTDTTDSAETHLIAYILTHYLSKIPDQKTQISQETLLLLVQTRPGQHEELVMQLSAIPGFSCRNIVRIYRIDEELEGRDFDEERDRQEGSLEEVKHHSHRASDHRKMQYFDPVVRQERQEAGIDRKTIHHDFFCNHENGPGSDHFRKNMDFSTHYGKVAEGLMNNLGEEKPHYATYEKFMGTNYAKSVERETQHTICEECFKRSRHADVFAAPSIRRTWPNTRSGHRKHEERTKACGICMERFNCYIQDEDEKMSTRFKARDSFERSFNDAGNFEKSMANKTMYGGVFENLGYGKEKISPKLSYVPWGRNVTSKCSCSEVHICTACFIKKLSPTVADVSENIYPKRGNTRERPETSPAALHGRSDGSNERQIEINRVEKNDKDESSEMFNGKNDMAVFAKDLKVFVPRGDSLGGRLLQERGSEENDRGHSEEELKNYGLTANDGMAREAQDHLGSKEESIHAEETQLHDDKELKNKLEKLLAHMEVKTQNLNTPGRVNGNHNEADNADKAMRNGEDSAWKAKRTSANQPREDEEGYSEVKENVDINLENNNGTSSRISSYGIDYDKRKSRGGIVNGADNKNNGRLKLSIRNDNTFEYDIFDQLDKNFESESSVRKNRRRDKVQRNKGASVDEDGKYVCKFCPDKKFNAVNVWKIHMRNSHKKCNCPCGEYFETREDYLAHFYRLFPLPCFLERKCPERFRSLYFQAVHHRERHCSDRPFYCVLCFDAAKDAKSRSWACFKDTISLRIHAESMGHDPNGMFLISSQSETDTETLPWSMKCSGIDFC